MSKKDHTYHIFEQILQRHECDPEYNVIDIQGAAQECSDRCCYEVVKAMCTFYADVLDEDIAPLRIRQYCFENGFDENQVEAAFEKIKKDGN